MVKHGCSALLLVAFGCGGNFEEDDNFVPTDGDALLDGNDALAKTATAFSDRLEAPVKGNERIIVSFEHGKRVVAGGVTAKNPYGYLRKITSYEDRSGTLVLYTAHATLEDVIKDNEFKPASVVASAAAQSGSQLGLRGELSVGGDFDVEPSILVDASVGQITLTKARVSMKPRVKLASRIRGGVLQRFDLSIDGALRVEAGLHAKALGGSFGEEKAVALSAPVLMGAIGVVPVFVQPKTLLGCTIGVDVPMDLDTSFVATADVQARALYADGKWTPTASSSGSFKPHFAIKPPAGTSKFAPTFNGECHVGFSFAVLVAGVAGPAIKVYPSIEGTLEPFGSTVNGRLENHLRGALAGEFQVFGRGVSAQLPLFDELLLSSPWTL